MKWVTRQNVKVDRVACPWLIKKFIDPEAEFLFVPPDEVLATAEREDATPFDVPDVELGHHGGKCSFEAIVEKYAIDEPAGKRLASRRSLKASSRWACRTIMQSWRSSSRSTMHFTCTASSRRSPE